MTIDTPWPNWNGRLEDLCDLKSATDEREMNTTRPLAATEEVRVQGSEFRKTGSFDVV